MHSSTNKNILFHLFIIVGLGLLVLAPFHNFQTPLATGDNGRDLYAFAQSLDGALPYRDYHWVYGPLMPFYYALFMKMMGVTIQSVLAGQILLWLVSGVLIAMSLYQAGLLRLGWSAALWFWAFNPRFTYTYNHAGGVACILGLVYVAFLYLKKPGRRYLIVAFFITAVLSFIKLNMGLAGLAALLVCVGLIDWTNDGPQRKHNIHFLVLGTVAVIGLVGVVYAAWLHSLPAYTVRECLPYLSSDRASHASLPQAVFLLMRHYVAPLTSPGPNLIFALIILTATGRLIIELIKPELNYADKRTIIIQITIPLIFWCFLLHEFFLSAVPYRLFWVTPLQILLIFLILGLGFRGLAAKIQMFIAVALLVIALLAQVALHSYIQRFKVPSQFLNYPRGQVYVANSQQWLTTLGQTVHFLQRNLAQAETFLALPYDPLYYFLTEKTSPIHKLFFHAYGEISRAQEYQILDEIEQKDVRYILLSNRAHAQIPELGTFGQTYASVLDQYIQTHYKPIKTFGDWDTPGGAFKNHAVRIYRRED